MGNQRYTLAGWLAITNAVLTIPFFVLSVFLSTQTGSAMKLATALLTIISLALFIIIFLSLKDFLNSRFSFQDTDIIISILIWANVAVSLFSIFGLISPSLEMIAGVVTLLLIIPFGIIFIVFAIKLLRLPDTLQGMLKPFAYTTIAAGFCFATIILIPVAFIASASADIILGIIFLRAAETQQGTSMTNNERLTMRSSGSAKSAAP